MNIIIADPHTGNDILNIPSLRKLRKAQNNYSHDKNAINLTELYTAQLVFMDWYLSYCDYILKGKVYTQSHICETIFSPDIANDRQYVSYIRTSLYVSKIYVAYLRTKLTEHKMEVYQHTLNSLEIDLEYLIVLAEVSVRRTVDKLAPNSWRKRILEPIDIYWAANAVFHIEELNKFEDLYLRDVKPVVMFQIRQCLEVYGRNIIGYWSINDGDGKPIKQFTQIAWQFLKDEAKKKPSLIEFPFNLNDILWVNSWSHNFAHTTYLYASYIQHYALQVIDALFQPSKLYIETITGKHQAFNYAAIKIQQYSEFKHRFVEYLHNTRPDAVVEWMDVKNVGAYIISS